MQILQWLFKNANDTNFNTTSTKKEVVSDQEVKPQEIVLFNIPQKKRHRAGKSSKSNCKILNLFNTLHRKDVAAKYFYSSIHLKRLGSSHKRQQFVHSMKMKKQTLSRGLSFRRKTASSTAKVLPVTDAAVGTPASRNGHKEQNFSADTKEKAKGDQTKTTSKMKELIKWATAAKSQKGGKYFGRKVLHLRDRSVSKAATNDDDHHHQFSYESPKISFRWDVESCSTTFSVTKNDRSINSSPWNSTLVHIDQCPPATRKGNWVTTDTEFVVLEL